MKTEMSRKGLANAHRINVAVGVTETESRGPGLARAYHGSESLNYLFATLDRDRAAML